MPTTRLVNMDAAGEGRLTLGEAAHRLGMDIDELLEMVYSQRLPAGLQQHTGRLLIGERVVEQLIRGEETEHAG